MIQYNNFRVSLDRREQDSDIDFVSHAHTDHLGAIKSSKSVLASTQTIELIEHTRNLTIRNRARNEGFRLVEAGHMLGSRQLCIEDHNAGMRVTYTGDFQTAKSKTAKPIDVIDTDVLIMDSTYADASIGFGEKDEVESALQEWTSKMLRKGTVIFSAYAMGKAQELISVFNEIGIKPIVSKRISRASNVYVSNGIPLDYSSAYDEDDDYNSMVSDNFVGITDSRNLAALKSQLESIHSRDVYTAMATGFAKVFRFRTDAQFPLSDHADFKQSKDYIDATGAKTVLTYGPNAGEFARNLNRDGYNSMPFSESAMAVALGSSR